MGANAPHATLPPVLFSTISSPKASDRNTAAYSFADTDNLLPRDAPSHTSRVHGTDRHAKKKKTHLKLPFCKLCHQARPTVLNLPWPLLEMARAAWIRSGYKKAEPT